MKKITINFSKPPLSLVRKLVNKLYKKTSTVYRCSIGALILICRFYIEAFTNYKGISLSKIKYGDVYGLHWFVSKRKYCKMIYGFQKEALERMRKRRIKLAFVLYDSSMWCGDELYNSLKNSGLDVMIYLCERNDIHSQMSHCYFSKGVEQIKSKGIKVVGISARSKVNINADILFYLTPYDSVLVDELQFKNISVDKLICYMDYSLAVWGGFNNDHRSKMKFYDILIRFFVWKEFVDTIPHFEEIKKYTYREGVFCEYTGYARMDTFYKANIASYPWKLKNDKSKKIIWAPHWSINAGCLYSTFQYNYKFMLEYAREHVESTSWIVKPHPNLLFSAVEMGVFSTEEEFNDYLKEWNDLPNAKVVTGGYYQDIFKSSDAMILDSGSFLAEYQYVNKPQLFLRRDSQNFNKIGKKIINAIYTVEGDDFDGIKLFIEDVVCNANDYNQRKRKEVFDKYLNYKAHNECLASEKICQIILSSLKED